MPTVGRVIAGELGIPLKHYVKGMNICYGGGVINPNGSLTKKGIPIYKEKCAAFGVKSAEGLAAVHRWIINGMTQITEAMQKFKK